MKTLYKVFSGIFNPIQCIRMIHQGEEELKKSGIELHEYGYPGITIHSEDLQKELLDLLEPYALKTNAEEGWDYEVDRSFGTGVNFLKYNPGSQLGMHTDMPLFKHGPDLQVLPEYKDRVCYLTVIVCLSKNHTGGELQVQDGDELMTVDLNVGDVIVLNSMYCRHQVTKVQSGKRFGMAAFFCGAME